MFRQFRVFAQTTTYLGVAVIASIWCGAFFLTNEAQRHAYGDGVRQADNLVRVFEAYLSRVLGGADSALVTLRDSYERDPQHFDITRLRNGSQFQNNIVMKFGMVDSDGFARLSDTPSIRPDKRVSEGDRDYFRFHANSKSDELYISAPSVGRLAGKLVFHLTRRLTAPDGSFGGVILATIDIAELEKFYSSIDIGPGGAISLFGFDGIVRAHSSLDPASETFVGRSVPQSKAFALYRQSPAGFYWNFDNARPQLENLRRLVFYRVVKGFPLIAIVALAEDDIFQQARLTAYRCYLIALLLTGCVIGAIVIGARHQGKLWATVAALEQSKLSLEQSKLSLEQSKLSLEQTNLWFHAALENMAHGLCMFDKSERLIVCNDRYLEMYGHTRERIKPGTTLREILKTRVAGMSEEDAQAYIEQRMRPVHRREPSYAENELRDGRIIAVSYQPMSDGGWVAIHQDITERKRTESQIAHLARHDSLTGIANRSVLIETMERALTQARTRGPRFAVLLLDLDLFKNVNDSLGHPTGDKLLKEVARRLTATLGVSDTVARLGGDEFAILCMIDGDQRAAAAQEAGRLLAAVQAPYDIDDNRLDIETSIGIALAVEHGLDVDQLLKNADLALYQAKTKGRNRFCFYEEEMGAAANLRHSLHSELRKALLNNELDVHYQPIIAIRTRDVVSVEALVRWPHRQRGMIPPADFIPIAEETGLINSIGEWVLRKACADAMGWPPHVKISVNLSPVQFRISDPTEMFRAALAESGLPPERLEIEITESVLLESTAENLDTLRKLHELGMSIVLDDFGTGYSSLSYLRMLPFDKIKIDRTFVHELSRNTDSASIVAAVANLGSSLRLATVAEGIETKEQLVLVQAAGCTHAQGFLFGRPCPAAEVTFGTFSGEPKLQRMNA